VGERAVSADIKVGTVNTFNEPATAPLRAVSNMRIKIHVRGSRILYKDQP
jgi:hypothetical protein